MMFLEKKVGFFLLEVTSNFKRLSKLPWCLFQCQIPHRALNCVLSMGMQNGVLPASSCLLETETGEVHF